jgi:type III pantothenate kinase
MTPNVVVDVGNTRIKWGLCGGGAVTKAASLAPDDPASWERQLAEWRLSAPTTWVLAGVHPARRDALADWLRRGKHKVTVLEQARDLPLRVALEQPDWAGIDRLVNAVAANFRRRPKTAAALVDAGSAVTVDFVDAEGVFRGGAIFPGLRLMAQALHNYTALLPLIEVHEPGSPIGRSTTSAMQWGVFWAVLGGIEALVGQMSRVAADGMDVFFTGGDAAVLAAHAHGKPQVWPTMTLEGIRLAAESLPPTHRG